MKNKIYLLKLCVVGLILTLSACKKQESLESVKPETKVKNTVTPIMFDWENIDYMPAPAGTNIFVPWASGANRSFPLIYATDIKKADGWELVYNSFSTSQFVQPAFFVLYNRYRGLLRGYFYLTPGSSIPSSNISHSLIQDVASNPAPLLSYSATEVANLSINSPFASTVQEYKTSATGTWYAAEFEMAYDPTIATRDAASTKMTWIVNSVNTTDIKLNGVSQGTIKGTITQPTSSSGILGSTVPGLLTFPYTHAIENWTGLDKGFQAALIAGVNSGLGGQVKNVLNGLFGGSSQSTQYANLTTSSNITMSGTATDVYQLHNPSLIIPGTQGQDNVVGNSPLYKFPLGIVSLSSYPIVYFETFTSGGDGDGPSTTTGWSLDLDYKSYALQFNPTIINVSTTGASIQNLKQEIVFFENYKTSLKTFDDGRPNIDEPIPLTDPTTEQMGSRRVIVNDLTSFSHAPVTLRTGEGGWTIVDADLYNLPFRYEEHTNRPNTGMYGFTIPANHQLSYSTDTPSSRTPYSSAVLRVSFDVVPNNGAPKSKIVKSFNLIKKSASSNRQ